MSVIPYKNEEGSKKEQVAKMFNNIAGKYDFLNHFLSLGIDILWRKKAVKILGEINPKIILDVATGTGDFAIESMSLKPTKIEGIDISAGMIDVGIEKIKKKKLDKVISLNLGDSEQIAFADNYFDGITCAFGVRNFEHLNKGLLEMNRVLKPKGMAVIIEFSKPEHFPVKNIYNFYFSKVLPRLGKSISSDNSAYTYLPESVKAFPSGNEFLQELEKANFKNCRSVKLTFGIASIYIGEK